MPAVAGLNLEHIVSGEHLDDSQTFFEPRNAPMSLRQVSDTEAELHQPPTPTFQVESWTQFRLTAPHYLDMSFRCVPRKNVFTRGYLALFWASYINAPKDKMFDRSSGVRFTHSPSGGGTNADLKTTNPAWDFQFLVQQPEVNQEYSFRVRTALRPTCSRDELLREFGQWQNFLRIP